MSNGISSDYRQLTAAELDVFHETYSRAWLDPAMPERQYRRVVASELEVWRRGDDVAPYRVALECLQKIPIQNPRLLDVGAASGYYRDVLAARGYQCRYTGIDFSEDFQTVAHRLFPGIKFDVGDCRELPYPDASFDVVLHGAVIMHVREYAEAIREAARVASRYIVFHRTPINDGPTTYFAKEAYGVPCMEIRFNEADLMAIFKACGLDLIESAELFWYAEHGWGHRTYLLQKQRPEPYASNEAV